MRSKNNHFLDPEMLPATVVPWFHCVMGVSNRLVCYLRSISLPDRWKYHSSVRTHKSHLMSDDSWNNSSDYIAVNTDKQNCFSRIHNFSFSLSTFNNSYHTLRFEGHVPGEHESAGCPFNSRSLFISKLNIP